MSLFLHIDFQAHTVIARNYCQSYITWPVVWPNNLKGKIIRSFSEICHMAVFQHVWFGDTVIRGLESETM